jgi:hypothetical protein
VRRERGSLHPLQMGAGVRSLLQKDTVFVLGLMTWRSDCFVESSSKATQSMYVLPGDARVNKLFANTECYIVACTSAV